MEIIKPGKLPSEKTAIGTCRNCNCEFRFKAGEAKFNSCQREGDYYALACPTCGKTVCVDAKLMQ